jgi:hypothetical protein
MIQNHIYAVFASRCERVSALESVVASNFVEAMLWCNDSGNLLVRETRDIITGRPGLRRFDRGPAPLHKHPPTLGDQCTAGSPWRHSSRNGVYDLYLASIVVVGHLPSQSLFVVIHIRGVHAGGVPQTCNITPPNEYTSLCLVGITFDGSTSSSDISRSSNSGAVQRSVPLSWTEVANEDPPSSVSNVDSPKSEI